MHNPNKDSAGQLFPFLLKGAPYLFAGGALYGLLSALKAGLSMPALLFTCLIYGLACAVLCMPLLILKWHFMRNDSPLTPQQQMVVGLSSWKVRAAISGFVSVLLTVGLFLSGNSETLWLALIVFPALIFLTLWMCSFVLRHVIQIPDEPE